MITAIMLAAAIATMLASCGTKAECDFCGEEKTCKTKNVFGETVSICNDCLDEMSGEYDDDNGNDDGHDDDDNFWNFENYDDEINDDIDEKNIKDDMKENEEDNLIPIDVYSGIEIVFSGANGFGSVRLKDYLEDTEFSVGDFYFKPLDSYYEESNDLRGYDVLKVINNNKEICQIGY